MYTTTADDTQKEISPLARVANGAINGQRPLLTLAIR